MALSLSKNPPTRYSATKLLKVLLLTLMTPNIRSISRSSLEDHLETLKEVLSQFCNAGLKVNAKKLTFCALEIEYQGYILTRDSIKPQNYKVQAILAIQPPKGVNNPAISLAWCNITVTSGQDRAKCLPPSPHWLESVVRPKS